MGVQRQEGYGCSNCVIVSAAESLKLKNARYRIREAVATVPDRPVFLWVGITGEPAAGNHSGLGCRRTQDWQF